MADAKAEKRELEGSAEQSEPKRQATESGEAAAATAGGDGGGEGPEIGCFSVSVAVKDLAASIAFYQQLGFCRAHGDPAHGYVIMRNGSANLGLFQGMFTENILTFNPGWDQAAQPVAPFQDVRALQARLKAAGVALQTEADAAGTGPASFTVKDPDGNVILVDQHVPAPAQ